MCTENEELLKIEEKHEADIMEAVGIIKEFGPDIKAINSMLRDHSRRIDEEVQERKEEIKNMKNNYIDRFDDIKKDIREGRKESIDGIKEMRKESRSIFISVSIFFFTAIAGVIISKIMGLL